MSILTADILNRGFLTFVGLILSSISTPRTSPTTLLDEDSKKCPAHRKYHDATVERSVKLSF